MPSNGFMPVKGWDAMNGSSFISCCPISLPISTVSTLTFQYSRDLFPTTPSLFLLPAVSATFYFYTNYIDS